MSKIARWCVTSHVTCHDSHMQSHNIKVICHMKTMSCHVIQVTCYMRIVFCYKIIMEETFKTHLLTLMNPWLLAANTTLEPCTIGNGIHGQAFNQLLTFLKQTEKTNSLWLSCRCVSVGYKGRCMGKIRALLPPLLLLALYLPECLETHQTCM